MTNEQNSSGAPQTGNPYVDVYLRGVYRRGLFDGQYGDGVARTRKQVEAAFAGVFERPATEAECDALMRAYAGGVLDGAQVKRRRERIDEQRAVIREGIERFGHCSQ